MAFPIINHAFAIGLPPISGTPRGERNAAWPHFSGADTECVSLSPGVQER